ncbi:MAG: hypothetical protein ACO3XO_00300 [Bdellovibrionota bacterium]
MERESLSVERTILVAKKLNRIAIKKRDIFLLKKINQRKRDSASSLQREEAA